MSHYLTQFSATRYRTGYRARKFCYKARWHM